MSLPVPRNLPSLTADAVRHGWEVEVSRPSPGARVHFRRGVTTARMVWAWDGAAHALALAEVDDIPTTYARIARLIRSPEGA